MVVARLVDVAELIVELTILNVARSLSALVSKLVPVMVTAVPTVPTVGVKLVIVGAPDGPEPTVNELELVADPVGLVTAIVPVVAPDGTVATIRLVLEAETVAAVPLKVQYSDLRWG